MKTPVIACDKREAFMQGSEAIILSPGGEMDCFATLAMTGVFIPNRLG